jgi:hypothetical protein
MPQRIIRLHHIDLRNGILAIVIGTCLLASSPGAITQAQAQNGQVGRAAWCIDMGNLGGYLECNYHTYEQCAAAARGVTNVCLANSFYVPQPQKRSRQNRNPQR